jgi:hypothetical protein
VIYIFPRKISLFLLLKIEISFKNEVFKLALNDLSYLSAKLEKRRAEIKRLATNY